MAVEVETRLSAHEGLVRAFADRLETRQFEKYGRRASLSKTQSEARELVHRQSAQQGLRRLYGKGDPQPPSIGDHPDFVHLRGTNETCHCPITTMFMDIESSTRLSLLFPLDDVRVIKNAFIRTAIDIIKSFDGHVHRIMGDAVMAYFGGTNATVEEGIIDGINCATVLQYFAEHVVIPQLQSHSYNHDFGIRIGLDHGPEERVMWSSYGYPNMEEVTATSFHVDVAAKLQHSAGRNQVMIGQSLRDTIDFPDCLLETKRVQRDGEWIKKPVVEPNHTDRSGQPINYHQYILKSEEYLKCSPLAQHSDRLVNNSDCGTLQLDASLHDDQSDESFHGRFFATGKVAAKDKEIRFKPRFAATVPYKIIFHVENHGAEASEVDKNGNHSTPYDVITMDDHQSLVHWESTSYRGLHYLNVEVFADGRLDRTLRYGVYIE